MEYVNIMIIMINILENQCHKAIMTMDEIAAIGPW
jgi:hypothetical protein